MTVRTELDDMLTRGPVADISRADEARSIVQAIGDNADAVNASTFSPALVAMQAYAIEQFVLAITRLFEKPSRRFQLRSLPAIVTYAIAREQELPLLEPVIFWSDLKHLGFTIAGSDLVATARQRIGMSALQTMIPSSDRDPSLDALKALRDKRLAHPEHVSAEDIPLTTWEPIEKALATAKLIVGVLGAFTGTAYVDNAGEYLLSSDAARAGFATRRLLREIGIGEPLWYEHPQ
jgi:hypothetical protein